MEARPNLFISPAGEPFRAAPDEAYPSAVWFARADANHDSRLSRAEMRADAEAFFHVLDANHDGVIDSYEVSIYEQTIVPEILGAYLGTSAGGAPPDAAPSGRGGGQHGGRGRGGRQGGSGAPPAASSASAPGGGGYEGAALFEFTPEPEPVMAADLDLSGHITLAEFLRTVDGRFEALDKGHTGAISFADLPRTPAQPPERGKHGRREGQPNHP